MTHGMNGHTAGKAASTRDSGLPGLWLLIAVCAYGCGTALLTHRESAALFWLLPALPVLASIAATYVGFHRFKIRDRLTSICALGVFGVYVGLAVRDAFWNEKRAIRGLDTRWLWSFLLAGVSAAFLNLYGSECDARIRRVGRAAALPLAVLVVLGAGYAAVIQWRLTPLGPDAGSYLLLAQRVHDGAVPYIDFRPVYHAGVYYVQVLWSSALGADLSGVRIQILTQAVGIAFLLGYVLSIRLNLSISLTLLLTAAYLAVVPALEGFFYTVEPMASLPGWAALALASAQGARSRHSERTPSLSPSDHLIGFATGLCCSLAFAIKQPAGVFLAAIPLPHIDRGRLDSRLLRTQLAGATILPLIFFTAHPHALIGYLESSVGGLWSYSTGRMVTTSPMADRSHSWAANALLPILLIGGLVISLVRLGAARRAASSHSSAPGNVLLLAVGCAALFPSLIRPYFHYYLFPWPFAVFSLAICAVHATHVGRSMSAGTRYTTVVLALGPLIAMSTPYFSFHVESRRNGRTEEAAVAGFISLYKEGRDRILVLPNTPQYYFLTGTRPPDDDPTFVDNQLSFDQAAERFRLAADGHLPAFLIDRGGGWLAQSRDRLFELGYVPCAHLELAATYLRYGGCQQ